MHPDDAEWEAWQPAELAQRLDGVDVPWRVSAGWAIDLFLGGERREHEDLELAVPADRFGEIAAALPELDFHVVTRGLAAPVAESAELMETIHQTWGLDRAGEPLAGRRLSRAVRRRRLGRPPRRVDPPPLLRADRAHARRDPLRASRGRAALQGEALAAEGRGGSRGGAAAPIGRAARAARGLDRARAPGSLLARRHRAGAVAGAGA